MDPQYKSKRLYAAGILVVATVASNAGIDIDPAAQGKLASYFTTMGTTIAAIVGVVLTVWSKWNEKKKAK